MSRDYQKEDKIITKEAGGCFLLFNWIIFILLSRSKTIDYVDTHICNRGDF
jgi:hypothetical protein